MESTHISMLLIRFVVRTPYLIIHMPTQQRSKSEGQLPICFWQFRNRL